MTADPTADSKFTLHSADEGRNFNCIESDPEQINDLNRPPAHQRGTDARDLILAALDQLCGIQRTGGNSSWSTSLARQKACLREWADGLGLVLKSETIAPFLGRGGQEHEIFKKAERVFKVTRNGVFGLRGSDKIKPAKKIRAEHHGLRQPAVALGNAALLRA